MTRFRAWLLWPLLVFLVGVLLGLLTSQLRYACGPWGVHCTTVADGLGRTAMRKEERMPDDTDNRLRQHAAMRQDIPRMLAGLLLASRVVDVPRSSSLIVVMLSFLGGVLNVDIDGKNTLQIKAIGAAISTFETLPSVYSTTNREKLSEWVCGG